MPETMRNDLWDQLPNVVLHRTTVNQSTWTVFSIFAGANAVMVAALIQSGHLPDRPAGVVVSLFASCLCFVWLAIQHRALAWLDCYEKILIALEGELFKDRPDVRLTGHQKEIGGWRARPAMIACPIIAAIGWAGSAWWFLAHS